MNNPYRILLAEDDLAAREIFKHVLEDMDYQADIVKDGCEAYEFLQKKEYDLLMTDIHMPKMNGIELFKRIRQDGTYLPVILMTNYPNENVANDLLQKGAVAYCPKEYDSLVWQINKHLRFQERKFENRMPNVLIYSAAPTAKLQQEILINDGLRPRRISDSTSFFRTLTQTDTDIVVLQNLSPEKITQCAERIRNTYPYIQIAHQTSSYADSKKNIKKGLIDQIVDSEKSRSFTKKLHQMYSQRKKTIEDVINGREPEIYILTGPKGTGKTTYADMITTMLPFTQKVVREVSRNPRLFEISGEDHRFLTESEIILKEECENYVVYPHGKTEKDLVCFDKNDIAGILKRGKDVILIVPNYQAFRKVKSIYPKSTSIMVGLDDVFSLTNRLKKRDWDCSDITWAMDQSKEYSEHRCEFDHVIYNDVPSNKNEETASLCGLETTSQKFLKIIRKN